MSLNNDDIAYLVGALRSFITDFDSGAAIADTVSYIPVWSDFKLLTLNSYTRNAIAAKLNRYYAETAKVGTPKALSES